MPRVEGVFGPDLLYEDEDLEETEDEETQEAEDKDPEESEGEPESTQPEEGVDGDGPEEDEGESEDEPEQAAESDEEPKQEDKVPEKEPEWSLGGKFKTPEDLAKSYRDLQVLMGRQAWELGQLRGQVGRLTQQLQYWSNPQNVLQAAEQIRKAQAPAQPGPASEPEEELPDPAKWLERFYQEGPKAVVELIEKREARWRQRVQELKAELSQALAQIEQAARQAVVPAQQYAAYEQLRASLEQQERELRADLQKQGINLDDYAEDVIAVMRENPDFYRFPNGMRLAFEIARGRKPVPKPNVAAKKMAARVTASIGTRPRPNKPDPERQLVEQIFGSGDEGNKGVFG